MTLRVNSEIGKLSSVLVHLPGPEIDRMVPAMMEELLFDDILFGARAREEHRRFQQVLGYVADEVLEAQDLLAEVLAVPDLRAAALEDLSRTLAWGPEVDERTSGLSGAELAAVLIAGIEKPASEAARTAADLYWLPPLPNYFFQRDPLVVVGERAVRCSMATSARRREPLLSGSLFEHHPRFARPGSVFWLSGYSCQPAPLLEGGDILVLREDILVIGCSQRTEKAGIERLVEGLKSARSPVRRVLLVEIPPARSYMHLDTVFTAISSGECLVYAPVILPGGAEEAKVSECDLTERETSWKSAEDLLSALKRRAIDLAPIRCGGSDPIAERREQWTDGANAFALAPGVVLIYDRNVATAEELSRAGYRIVDEADLLLGREDIDLLAGGKCAVLLAAHELSRARGGPRCMAMPLVRAEV